MNDSHELPANSVTLKLRVDKYVSYNVSIEAGGCDDMLIDV